MVNSLGHWGWNYVPNYNEEYFLEIGQEMDSLCPYEFPKSHCPHRTKGNPKHYWWEKKNIYLNESGDKFRIPDEIQMIGGVYNYSGIGTLREIVKNKDLMLTNYLPIIIYNLKVDSKYMLFLQLLNVEVEKGIRSVILDTNGMKIPVESFVERIKK